MKKLYLIGGTMGVGKTTTCQVLKTKLDKSVFLDGDWCWDMHPFVVNKETKKLVLNNICTLLNNDIKCNTFENIIFCWVMHEQSIIDDILSRLDLNDVKVIAISLVCQKEALEKRIQKDIDQGTRKPDVLARSVERLEMYQKLNTYKIDVSNKTIEEIVKENHLEKEALQKLKESVQTLEGIEGLLCVEMEENLTSGYDLVFYSEFENLEALKNFQNHSLHEAHKKRCRNLVCERLCGDVER